MSPVLHILSTVTNCHTIHRFADKPDLINCHPVQRFKTKPERISEFNFLFQQTQSLTKDRIEKSVFHIIADHATTPIVNDTIFQISLNYCEIYHQFPLPLDSSLTIKQTLFPNGEYPVNEPQLNYILDLESSTSLVDAPISIPEDKLLEFYVTPKIPHKDLKFTNNSGHPAYVYIMTKTHTQNFGSVHSRG
jgi:hypothetical protein